MPLPFSRSLAIALLLLALTIPYAITSHTYPIPTFYAELICAGCYLLIAATTVWTSLASRQREALPSPRVASVPLAFGLWLLMQMALLPTAQPSTNLFGAACLLAALLCSHSGYWIGQSNYAEVTFRSACYALVIGGLFAVFCQFVQIFHLEARFSPFIIQYSLTVERRPFANMAQPNHLATYLSFAMIAALYLVATRRIPLLFWVVLTIIYSVGQALTVSRTAWLQTAVIVAGAIAMALAQQHSSRTRLAAADRSRHWSLPLLLIAAFFAGNLGVRWADSHLGWQLARSALERFEDIGQISPRLALWRYGWTMFIQHPWFGVGWGEFPRYQYQLVETLGGVEIANNAHNLFIDLLAKTGIVGALIALGGLALWLRRALAGGCALWRIAAILLLAALGVHTLFEYPQQYLFFLLPAAFMIGLLETRPIGCMAPAITQALVGGATLMGIAALYPIFSDYQRAQWLYYGSAPYDHYRAAPALLFGAWGKYGMATLEPIDKHDLSRKIRMHEQAMTLLPGETVLRRYAVLLALNGQTREALDVVKRLQIFAHSLHHWPAELASLRQLCNDVRDPALQPFKNQLASQYGLPLASGGTRGDD